MRPRSFRGRFFVWRDIGVIREISIILFSYNTYNTYNTYNSYSAYFEFCILNSIFVLWNQRYYKDSTRRSMTLW